MKVLIGILLILGGIALGIYLGFWVCFVGGIVGLVTAIRVPVSALTIAMDIAKVFFAGVIGWLSAIILIIPGVAILNHSN